jgi:protein SCO1/2
MSAPLTNQHGAPVTLNSFKGKTVLLVPFLTLCADICPLTTGNLSQVEQSLSKQNAANMVQVVEMSVDPGRDTPARLSAYAKLTGAKWQLVTESPSTLSKIAKFFGFYYQKIPEDSPPSIDWLTGKPLTYDIDHSDGYVVISPNGVEKFVTAAAPEYHGTLNPVIYRFLSEAGLQHLKHEPGPSYVPGDILKALSWSMQMNLKS